MFRSIFSGSAGYDNSGMVKIGHLPAIARRDDVFQSRRRLGDEPPKSPLHSFTNITINREVIVGAADIDPEVVKNISAQLDAEIMRALRYGYDIEFSNKYGENYSHRPGDPYVYATVKFPVT